MAPKDVGKGIAPKDLGKGVGGEQKSSHSRAGLGARHSQKPRPDVGLLAEAMAPHIALVKDLGAYEQLSATHGADYHGMVSCGEPCER